MTGSPQDAIRSTIDAVTRAIAAKDAPAVAAHYDAAAVQFSLAPPLRVIGRDEAGLKEWFTTWQGPIRIEFHDLAVTANDDLAICTSLNRMRGTKTDGAEVDVWYRGTLGLRRADDGWRIVHEHTSVPFYMDGSVKAAVDLKP